MDLTNFEQKYAYYGQRHATDPNLFWNGIKWQEDKPSKILDFSWKKDKFLVATIAISIVLVLVIFIGLN